MRSYVLVNFGGPRCTEEIEPFLRELLCDPDVIRTKFPRWFHHWFFGRIAKKRAVKINEDYEKIGFSPIYEDTEAMKCALEPRLNAPVFTFHRYMPNTHAESLLQIETCDAKEICVIPLFPQFCYGTTGSIARFFSTRLSPNAQSKLQWIKSYAAHPSFIEAWTERISLFLKERKLREEEVFLFFSAHGVPRSFIDEGDPYERECNQSVREVMNHFPNVPWRLAYQSKFGRGEWLRPYTDEECKNALAWAQGRKEIVFVPISFTSDHIETLFEIEALYLPLIRDVGLNAHRCPALNLEPSWIFALEMMAKQREVYPNQTLVRKK